MNVDRPKKHDAVIGIMLAILVYVAASFGYQQWMMFTPASYWFDVHSISIADSIEGQDPTVDYRPLIKRDVHAEFTVSITRHTTEADAVGVIYCIGSGSANYVAGRALPPAETSMAWLMNREQAPCKFEPGVYRARVVWTLYPEGYPTKTIVVDSNYFRIKSKAEAAG